MTQINIPDVTSGALITANDHNAVSANLRDHETRFSPLTPPTGISALQHYLNVSRGGYSFVKRNGTGFTLDGRCHKMFFGSINGASTPPSAVVAQAQALNLNTVRFTDWLNTSGVVGIADRDATKWSQVDANIAALRAAGLKCILDLSCYRNLLKTSGVNPYTADWSGFLTFVLNRVNIVSGVTYKNDPTIAYVAFAGETDAPGSGPYAGTSSQLTTFFSTVSAYWKSNGGQQLCTPGGWLFMDNQGAGIPVAAIAALSTIDFIGVHAYSATDLAAGIPFTAATARAAGKPWVSEESGIAVGSGVTAAQQAFYFNQRYVADDVWGAAGEGFWNIALTDGSASGFDIATTTPAADAIRARSAGVTPAVGQPSGPPATGSYFALVLALGSGLAGYWRLGDYTSGGSAADSSGNGLTGTYASTGTASVTGLLTGDANAAIAVTGAGGGMTVPYNALFNLTTQATINMWAQSSSWTSTGDQRMLQKSTSDGIYQILNSSSGVQFKLGGLANVTIPWPSSGVPHMLTLTYNSAGILAYLDGQLAGAAGATSAIASDTGPLTIGDKPGSGSGGDQFNGTVDEVAIWKRALTPAEVLALYNKGAGLL